MEVAPLSNEIFDPEPGEEAWVIEEFAPSQQLLDAMRDPRTLPDLSRTELADLQVRAVGGRFRQRGSIPYVALQAIDRSKVIKPQGLSIVLDGGVFRHLEEPGLQIGNNVDAVITEGRLVFDKLARVRRIVDIGAYYREATEADVTRFLERDELLAEDADSFRSHADQWVRRRVALIMDTGILETCSARMIRDVAQKHNLSMSVVRRGGRERIVIPTGKRPLKEVLRFLSEDIYKGPLTATDYVTNSKRRRR